MITAELRRAIRSLLRTPSFTLPLAATVALSAAIVTTTFAVAYGILFRPLPYPNEGRLVRLYSHYGLSNDRGASMSPPDFADRAASKSFSSAAFWRKSTAVFGGAEPLRVDSAAVSADFYRTLGVQPELGSLSRDENALVLSDGAWKRRFGGAPDVIGRTLVVDGKQRTVAAVMPPHFAFPDRDVEVWMPMLLTPDAFTDDNRGNEYLEMIARLAPHATVAGAQAEADVLSHALLDRVRSRRQFLVDSHWRVVIRGLHDDLVSDVRMPMLLLLAGALLVFGIGAANAVALVLARVAARERETSVRSALGASAFRAAAPRIFESLLVVLLGGVAGVGLTVVLVDAVIRSGSVLIGRPDAVRLDGPVLGFAAAVIAATALLAAAAASIRPRLSGGMPGRFATVASARFRSALVVAEVALATALLIAGALVVESLRRLSAGDPGFRPQGAMTFRITAPEAMQNDTPRLVALYGGIQSRLRAMPGITAVSATSALPFSPDDMTATFHIEGRAEAPGSGMPAGKYRRVLPGFPEALGIRLLRGRSFDLRETPDTPRYAVIDEAAAQRYWPNEDPIGKRITYSSSDAKVIRWREIVGVVGTIRHASLGEQPEPHVYFDALQSPDVSLTYVVRSALPASAVIAGIRAAVRATDPALPIDRIEPLESYVAASLAQPRFGSAIVIGFGVVALFLTCIGIYGLLAYLVTERRREFAVRMAIGANAANVSQLVVRGGLRLASLGVVLGICGALAASGALRSVLYSVGATNPVAYAGVSFLLLGIAAVASWIPARRASRLDPAVALRVD
jgi:putative ABC transport system permease protein